jgi:hypothetical protein
MSKKYLLFAGKEIDTEKQTVEVNQVIQLEGYSYDKYVVYEISKNQWGITYKLINLRTKEFGTSDLIRPLSEKFGIGHYYDDVNPQFLDAFEVAVLREQAQQQKKAAQDEAEKEKIRVEEVKEVGRKRFAEIFPENAQAVIVAQLKQDESDSQSDYFASSTQRTVILGFSTHKRDIFSEMRKYASNFEETAYLAAYNEKYEHREKYSMGAGYYLGESNYHGWIIQKVSVYDRNRAIEEFAYTAGDEANIRTKTVSQTAEPTQATEAVTGNYTIVDYSEKAVAIFGDTKTIKEQLSALGGRFNLRLTLNGKKCAGWIFQKSKEQDLRQLVNLN